MLVPKSLFLLPLVGTIEADKASYISRCVASAAILIYSLSDGAYNQCSFAMKEVNIQLKASNKTEDDFLKSLKGDIWKCRLLNDDGGRGVYIFDKDQFQDLEIINCCCIVPKEDLLLKHEIRRKILEYYQKPKFQDSDTKDYSGAGQTKGSVISTGTLLIILILLVSSVLLTLTLHSDIKTTLQSLNLKSLVQLDETQSPSLRSLVEPDETSQAPLPLSQSHVDPDKTCKTWLPLTQSYDQSDKTSETPSLSSPSHVNSDKTSETLLPPSQSHDQPHEKSESWSPWSRYHVDPNETAKAQLPPSQSHDQPEKTFDTQLPSSQSHVNAGDVSQTLLALSQSNVPPGETSGTRSPSSQSYANNYETSETQIPYLQSEAIQSEFGEDLAPVPSSLEEKMRNNLVKLKSSYRYRQHGNLWQIIRTAALKHGLSQDNAEPFVIMFASLKKASSARENLAIEIAKWYSIRCGNTEPTQVSGKDFMNLKDTELSKQKLHQMMLEGFESESCAAVVSNFEKIPSGSTRVFYSFCENNNAPYKNVIIVFTLELSDRKWMADKGYKTLLEGRAPESSHWSKIVEEYLEHSLNNSEILTEEMIPGLLTRITPFVVWVE